MKIFTTKESVGFNMSLKKSIQWAIATDTSMKRRFRGFDERAKSKGAMFFDSVHNYTQFILLWEDTFWMFRQAKEKDKKRWLLNELKIMEQREWQLAKKVYAEIFNLQEKGDK